MPARIRSTVAATSAAALLVAGGAWAVAAHSSTSGHAGRAARPAAADRFLQLTGDAAGSRAAKGSGKTPPGQAKKASSRACLTDPTTVGMMPNGWCIRPAGSNVDVLRFPLGLLPV